MSIFVYLLFITIIFKVRSYNLILDFLKYNKLRNAIIYDCNSFQDKINTIKYFSKFNVQISSDSKEFNIISNNLAKIGLILNYECVSHKNILDSAVFNQREQWLILTNHSNAIFNDLKENSRLNLDSDVTIAINNRNQYILYDVYNSGFDNHGSFNMTNIGFWSEMDGLNIKRKWKYEGRFNLSGVQIKCMTVIRKKLVNETAVEFLESFKDTHIDTMHRFSYNLLKHVKEMFKFQYIHTHTNSWGYNYNGSFDGMVGYLQRFEGDVGGSPAFWRLERAMVTDGLVQTWTNNRPCFVLRHPKLSGSFWTIYTRPLKDEAWYYFILLTLFVIAILILLFHINKNMNHSNDHDLEPSFAILGTIGAISQQGVTYNTSSGSIKIVLFTLFIFSVLTYQFYSASIVSSLLREPPKNIKTIKDLLFSQLDVTMDQILYTIDFFKKSTDPFIRKFYQTKVLTKPFQYYTPEQGIELVKRGGYAYHSELPVVYKLIRNTFTENEICDLVEIPIFRSQRMMQIIRKGSPYRKLFIYGLRRIQESGVMDKQIKTWFPGKPRCVKAAQPTSVTFYEFSAVFVILGAGMIFSLVILILEFLVHYIIKHKLKNVTTKLCKK